MQLGNREEGITIAILDSCRNNPYERRWHRDTSRGSGLGVVQAPAGTFIATPPRQARLQKMAKAAWALHSYTFKTHADPWHNHRNTLQAGPQRQVGKQLPWESSSIIGEFYFVPKGTTVAETTDEDPWLNKAKLQLKERLETTSNQIT